MSMNCLERKDCPDLMKALLTKQHSLFLLFGHLPVLYKSLEQTGEADVEGNEPLGTDPNHIKVLIKDAIVLLGNAHCRVNSWRQKRFAEFSSHSRNAPKFHPNS